MNPSILSFYKPLSNRPEFGLATMHFSLPVNPSFTPLPAPLPLLPEAYRSPAKWSKVIDILNKNACLRLQRHRSGSAAGTGPDCVKTGLD